MLFIAEYFLPFAIGGTITIISGGRVFEWKWWATILPLVIAILLHDYALRLCV